MVKIDEVGYQAEVVRRLIRVALTSNQLLSRLGTKDYPVEARYAYEFERCEMAVADLYEFLGK